MQDYSNLYPKRFRTKKFSDSEKLDVIKKILKAGIDPISTVACLVIFLAYSRR